MRWILFLSVRCQERESTLILIPFGRFLSGTTSHPSKTECYARTYYHTKYEQVTFSIVHYIYESKKQSNLPTLEHYKKNVQQNSKNSVKGSYPVPLLHTPSGTQHWECSVTAKLSLLRQQHRLNLHSKRQKWTKIRVQNPKLGLSEEFLFTFMVVIPSQPS